ncbi:hypothetical protein SAMN05444397_109212 [Flavobacterium aquidurense]|uniref:TonB protein C-terminal n=1 Tax=Flavobacterium frigidimaris TaxID=262320 RepID=A0ABX4BV04_FLAFR|nr:hypothetical protein [Flavobacterium frigidimaris]OXA81078.1 hypothetical protein B0A65_04865 [Flavobacterium frigidimaris]SDZ58742.1 hypothetical protein SAMN05444397_109212 [Flavobacterium aquidurense]
MKKIFLILICILFVSCNFEKKDKKSRFDNISKKDTTCLKDVENAKVDIKKGKLIYCHTMGGLLYHGLRSEKEATLVFKQNNIEFKGIVVSDLVDENQTHCYCSFMKEKIIEKYGEKFIDSILTVSDKLYVKNITNDTLYYANCDKRPNYPNDKSDYQDEFSDVLQKEVETKITYPKDYKNRKNINDSAYAFVDIRFYVNKKGKATIANFNFIYDLQTNHKFDKELKEEIKKYLKTENWKPAQIRGKNVNSDMVFRYELK